MTHSCASRYETFACEHLWHNSILCATLNEWVMSYTRTHSFVSRYGKSTHEHEDHFGPSFTCTLTHSYSFTCTVTHSCFDFVCYSFTYTMNDSCVTKVDTHSRVLRHIHVWHATNPLHMNICNTTQFYARHWLHVSCHTHKWDFFCG